MRKTNLQLVATGLLAWSITAQAAVVIDVSQVGGDVVFTSSGTLDLTGALTANPTSYAYFNEGIISGSANWYYAQGNRGPVNVYRLSSAAGSFGDNDSLDFHNGPDELGNPTWGGSSTGTNFAIWGDSSSGIPVLFVGTEFVSGSQVSGGLTFVNQTIASMGLFSGEYLYTIPNDTVTLRIGTSTVTPTVPLPAAAWLLLSGLAGLGFVGRRRKVD